MQSSKRSEFRGTVFIDFEHPYIKENMYVSQCAQTHEKGTTWQRDCARPAHGLQVVSSSPRGRSPWVPVLMIWPGIRVVVGGISTISGSRQIIPNTPPDPVEGLEFWRERIPPLTLEGRRLKIAGPVVIALHVVVRDGARRRKIPARSIAIARDHVATTR